MLDKTYWFVPGRIVVSQYSGRVMPDDMQSGVQGAVEYINADGQPPGVHIIVDLSHATSQHPDVVNIRNLREWALPLSDNPLALSRIVIDPRQIPLIKSVVNILGRVVHPRTYIVPSWQEALQKLQASDKTLPDLFSIRLP